MIPLMPVQGARRRQPYIRETDGLDSPARGIGITVVRSELTGPTDAPGWGRETEHPKSPLLGKGSRQRAPSQSDRFRPNFAFGT